MRLLSVFLIGWLAADAARADRTPVSSHLAEGRRRAERGDHAGAIDELVLARAAEERRDILYLLGEEHGLLVEAGDDSHAAAAIEAFQRYLALAPKARNRPAVELRIAALIRRRDAALERDRVRRAAEVDEENRLAAEEEARQRLAEEAEEERRAAEEAPGEVVILTPPAPPPGTVYSPRVIRTGWVLLGVGVGMASVGGGLLMGASVEAGEAEGARLQSDWIAHSDRADHLRIPGGIFLGAGVATLVTGVILAALPGPRVDHPTALWIAPMGRGMAVGGTF